MKNKNYIRLFKPSVGKNELNAVKNIFNKSWLGYGSSVNNFENKFSKFIGTKYAVGVNSCTAALHLALAVNKFPSKKKVLLPNMTFSATAASILYNNLTPVFVDINNYDLNMSFEDLKKKYSNDCVAVIAVHFGGHPCEMDKIVPWAKKKNLIVIEDCAHTCGGIYKGKKLGNWGDYSCFSFEDKKVITTGDGGMLCTNNKKKIKLLRSLSFHGWDVDPLKRHLKKTKNSWYYEIKNLGYKYNMNNLAASIGIEQLKSLPTQNLKRIKIMSQFIKFINNCKNFKFAFPYNLTKSCYWLFTLKVKNRSKFMFFMKKRGISTSVHIMPLTLHPIYKKYNTKLSNSLNVWKNLVSLPFFPDLNKKQINYIVKSLKDYDSKYF